MNFRKLPIPLAGATLACGLVLVSSSCRRGGGGQAEEKEVVPVVASELRSNGLATLPGALYQSQMGSSIHWQPWTKESLENAKAARRLIFCVIALPQQPGFLKVLSALAGDPATVEAINMQYVPILVDGDAAREMGLLTADLCSEINRSLQLPLFVWMTYEGNPVAWIPAPASDPDTVISLFNQSHSMVSQMWEDERLTEEVAGSYVVKNSAMDNANRRERFAKRKVTAVSSEQPATDVLRSLRQLTSLYDSYSRTFDEAGGLFPASSLELLSMASTRPGVPADLREKCLEIGRELLVDLLPSAMFDPLDGGVFLSRRGTSWALPSFVRDCPTQARVACSLIELYRATGDVRALDKALGLIGFAEKNYRTEDGLFAVGLTTEPDPSKWMWSVEEVETVLGPEDSEWWIKATGMKGLGNLPSEADPRREYFRGNTIGMGKSMAGIAAELSLPLDVFKPRFEAARAKLLAVRDSRMGKPPRDSIPHAGATFRMVSAYAAAFAITGDEGYREKAVALLGRGREAFGDGPRLRAFVEKAPAPVGDGRAFLYALALQSALDVAAITSDEQWLVWSEDLATTAAEMFTGDGFLKECPDAAKIIDLPITDLVMLFDDSTGGLVSLAESRLAGLGRPLVGSFSKLATPLPTYAIDRPILHTDLLFATLVRHYPVTVLVGRDTAPDLAEAVRRLPPRSIQRRNAQATDEIPAGGVRVLLPENRSMDVSTPAGLREALLPSSEK